MDFDFLGRALTDRQIKVLLNILHNGIVHFITGHPHRMNGYQTTQRDQTNLGGAAADIHDHIADRLHHRQARPDSRRHRFFNQVGFLGTGIQRRLTDRSLLHRGNTGGHTNNNSRPRENRAIFNRLVDKILQHTLCDVKIGNHAVLNRANSHDVAGSTAQHFLGLITHRQDFTAVLFHRHHRRLGHNGILALNRYQSVGCAQVNTNINVKQAVFSFLLSTLHYPNIFPINLQLYHHKIYISCFSAVFLYNLYGQLILYYIFRHKYNNIFYFI